MWYARMMLVLACSQQVYRMPSLIADALCHKPMLTARLPLCLPHPLCIRFYTKSHATIESEMEGWVTRLDASMDSAPLVRYAAYPPPVGHLHCTHCVGSSQCQGWSLGLSRHTHGCSLGRMRVHSSACVLRLWWHHHDDRMYSRALLKQTLL